MNKNPYSALMTVMTVALIGLAAWQVYGLVWSDPAPSISSVQSH